MSVLGSLDYLKVMTNTSSTNNPIAIFNNGLVGIDDKGIVAIYLSSKYDFKEKTTENVKVLSFKEPIARVLINAEDGRLYNYAV